MQTAWLPLYKGQTGRFLKSFLLSVFVNRLIFDNLVKSQKSKLFTSVYLDVPIFHLFAKTILHCPLQSVTITQVAGPPEIFTGFSCLLHLEINQTPIQVGL